MTDHDLHMTIAELKDEVARLKAELELETDQADRWSRKATALQSAAIQAHLQLLHLVDGPHFCMECNEALKALHRMSQDEFDQDQQP